jgi:hypothetical protein
MSNLGRTQTEAVEHRQLPFSFAYCLRSAYRAQSPFLTP